MDKVTKQFYEAMDDVLPDLILDNFDYKSYRVAKAKNLIPPFELLIELIDFLPPDIALAALRKKEDLLDYGWETDTYLYAIKKLDTEETKRLRRQRRKAEREARILSIELGDN